MSKTTLFLLNYNSYYNRLVKFHDNISAYLSEDPNYVVTSSTNFTEGDGVNTSFVVNVPENFKYDYAIAVNETTGAIQSRWFVIEAGFNAKGQYSLSLHRDLMADFNPEILAATAFVERAMITDTNNPLIFNSENFLTNEIKQQEILLKDSTKCPWIVGYLAPNAQAKEIKATSESYVAPTPSHLSYEEWKALSTVYTIDKLEATILGTSPVGIGARFTVGSTKKYEHDIQSADGSNFHFTPGVVGKKQGLDAVDALQEDFDTKFLSKSNETDSLGRYETSSIITSCKDNTALNITRYDTISGAMTETGVLFRDAAAGKNFKAKVKQTGTQTKIFSIYSGALYNEIKQLLVDNNFLNIELPTPAPIIITAKLIKYSTTVEETSNYAVNMNLHGAEAMLKDAPYKMFCIPYPLEEEDLHTTLSGNRTFYPKARDGLNIAKALAISYGEFCYDVQILPYCPALSFKQTNGINLTQIPINQQGQFTGFDTEDELRYHFSAITDEANMLVSYALWCDSASFTTPIATNISVPTNAKDFKIEHETSFYRLNSPNHSGSFQFKATSNGGVDGFIARCTYKPYSPFIQVAPIFKQLYGGDYGDARGLICGGSFSIARINDAWATYQIQNKAYLDSFNRQIENMEVNYNLQRRQQEWSSGIAVMTSTMSGAIGGGVAASSGGPYATAAGLVVGGVSGLTSSVFGREKDLFYADQLHREATSYAQDQFNLSLQNIQALPHSLANISSFDVISKYFPYLEYFSCTDEEKEALRKKIDFSSMSVGVIGTISDYLAPQPTYISAQLIRLEELGEDYHLISAIAGELHKGIYI